jgi:carbon monoxide dehydrogenase subunit G
VQLTSAIRIGRPAPEVIDALLDPGKVAACLPGSRLIGEVAEGTYAGELRVRIGPVHAVYAGTVHLDAADRAAGTATLSASGRERSGQGSADANVTLRVVPHGATARVLISADLMIRGTAAQYAPGAIGDVSQRLVEQFAGNVEELLAAQAGHPADAAAAAPGAAAAPPGWRASRGQKRAAAAAAVLLTAGTLAGLAAWLVWRRRAGAGGWRPGTWPRDSRPLGTWPLGTRPQDPAIPRYSSPEGARHG